MKKLFFLAATAMLFAACTSDELALQEENGVAGVQSEAVGFDVYVPAATQTRAGLEGTMTTSRMQRSEAKGGGFGVYAYLVEDLGPASGEANATAYAPGSPSVPNFMVNEKLLWNTVNQGWYYNPLKYWPNETDFDSQTSAAQMIGSGSTSHLDRLTFFAYAPYVSEANTTNPGITYVTTKTGTMNTKADGSGTAYNYATGEARIGYKAALSDPNKAVDLLWGVAPAGGLSYTAVNGRTVNVNEGMPLIDMTKPNVNTNMKFLFQHSLARLGVKVVAAIDQIGAGGTLDPNTRITINEVTLTGYFGETGNLNLHNTLPSVANWININGVDLGATTAKGDLTKKTITISGDYIAEHLRSATTDHTAPASELNHIGVTTVKQDLLEPAVYSTATPWVSSKTYAAKELKYSETTPYYSSESCSSKITSQPLGNEATGSYYTIDQNGVYTFAHNAGKAATYTYPAVMKYYDVAFHKVTSSEVSAGTYATYTAYDLDITKGTNNAAIDDGDTFTPKADTPAENDYVITSSELKVPYYAAGTYFKRDANYFMVIPTNNIEKICTSGITSSADKEALRTVRVKIDYYITTEDGKLTKGRAQTKNVIEKDVVFPSLANGKSYNLNLILGLTSVKMEAEVDDWKVINVNADLPQNTAE